LPLQGCWQIIANLDIGRTGMRLIATVLATFSLSACMIPMGMGMGMPVGLGSNPAEAAELSANLQQAQALGAAQASHPGDEAMTCTAIEAELVAQMQDPKFAAALGNMTSGAKDQKARQDRAMAGGGSKPGDAESSAAFQASTGGNLVAMMPQIMRGQRLNELATAKKCPFLKEMK
jgi:hypothetical protein